MTNNWISFFFPMSKSDLENNTNEFNKLSKEIASSLEQEADKLNDDIK